MLAGKPNPKADALFSKARTWPEEKKKLRDILLGCGLIEEVKWAKPCYTFQDTNIVIIVGFRETCTLLFCQGALLKDAKRVLIQPTENSQSARQLRFTSLKEIVAMESLVKSYIREAIAAEKAGLKVSFKQIDEFTIPAELQTELDEDPEFKTAFKALTPGRQRAYLLHFSAPKQGKTREARIEKLRQQILDGKGLDDDYRSMKVGAKAAGK